MREIASRGEQYCCLIYCFRDGLVEDAGGETVKSHLTQLPECDIKNRLFGAEGSSGPARSGNAAVPSIRQNTRRGGG